MGLLGLHGSATCHCGSRVGFAQCCRPLHVGARAAITAEQLMRSRYSAFATRDTAYLVRTWHPATRPADPGGDPALTWERLTILATKDGGANDDTGTVTFRAHFRGPHGAGNLHERSRFVRRRDHWVYVDGDQLR